MPHTELRVADVLDRTPWVKSLGEVARDRLYSDAFLASYQSGQTVARKGTLSSSWIGVAGGLLKIAAASRSGKIVRAACGFFSSTASCQRGETPHSQKEAQCSCDDHGAGAAYAPRRRTLPGRASVIEASRITAVPLTKT